MKISRNWLQTFFEKPLPDSADLAHALTFHAFEIESVDSDILDVKITPNRGHDCLSYRGIAREVSAILKLPLIADPHANLETGQQFSMQMPITVSIQDPELCNRYIGWSIKGVKVGPSPKWLVERLASMGQTSINNVVDVTNFVMLNLGQPLHAFDAHQLKQKGGVYAIGVRRAKDGEKIVALDDKEYSLYDSMVVIVDACSDVPIGIAGVKGGKPAKISDTTTDIIIESANFNGVSVRRTASVLKLRTDASSRFEQVISPELAPEGMRMAAQYILELAGGELASFADEYPHASQRQSVTVSLEKINRTLGTAFESKDAEDVFERLAFSFTVLNDTYTVLVPSERLDILSSEDLIEEVGRIIGYDHVPSIMLPASTRLVEVNAGYRSEEIQREELIAKGYSEIITSVFADKGERAVLNKVDSVKPYLRANLTDGLQAAYEKNMHNKDLLGLNEIRLFEIGSVWCNGAEEIKVGTIDTNGAKEEELSPSKGEYEDFPLSLTNRYQSFSRYPSIVRDIALWVLSDTPVDAVLEVISRHAGTLLVRSALFDEFKKGEKTSYAFRLVFQSFDRTLFDGDANERMESIYIGVKEKGWEVR